MDKSILFTLLSGETVANSGGVPVNRMQFSEFTKKVTMDFENIAFYDAVLDYAYRWEYWMSKLSSVDVSNEGETIYPSVLVVEETLKKNNASGTGVPKALQEQTQKLPQPQLTTTPALTINSLHASNTSLGPAKVTKVAELKSSAAALVRSGSSLEKIVSILLFAEKPYNVELKKNKSFNDCVHILERQQHQKILATAADDKENSNSIIPPFLLQDSGFSQSLPEILLDEARSPFFQKEFRVLRRLDLEEEKRKERCAFGIPAEHLTSKAEFDKFCRKRCRDITSKFLTEDNPFELNISGATKRNLIEAIEARNVKPIIFKKALDEVIINISSNSFPKFIKQKTLYLGDTSATNQFEFANFY